MAQRKPIHWGVSAGRVPRSGAPHLCEWRQVRGWIHPQPAQRPWRVGQGRRHAVPRTIRGAQAQRQGHVRSCQRRRLRGQLVQREQGRLRGVSLREWRPWDPALHPCAPRCGMAMLLFGAHAVDELGRAGYTGHWARDMRSGPGAFFHAQSGVRPSHLGPCILPATTAIENPLPPAAPRPPRSHSTRRLLHCGMRAQSKVQA
mmetsp:Transcript_2893/g.6726  ORF Transcript_2893/g.6726 Transcript_2893/m.6726 type:complete len:202 (+) Transcript_2893:709-1314(+)